MKANGENDEAARDKKEASLIMPSPAVDTSHYDVPRKLLQERAAALKESYDVDSKEPASLSPADGATNLPLVMPSEQLLKEEKKPVPSPKLEENTSLGPTTAREENAAEPLQSSVKKKGTYDIPRSAPITSSKPGDKHHEVVEPLARELANPLMEN